MTPRVKICGVTRVEDAVLAAELGAAAIGLVFWPQSPRCVTLDRARAIVAALPPFVTAVGVFVDQAPDEVRRVVETAGVGAVQLHGRERIADFATVPARLIKAVPVVEDLEAGALADLPPEVTILLDAPDPVRFGGTGRLANWDLAARIAARRPIVLAGGLRPDNVAAAVARVKPAAVDVSSGVERAPGVKDPAKVRALFDALALGRRDATRGSDR